jgi:hypothetical protein
VAEGSSVLPTSSSQISFRCESEASILEVSGLTICYLLVNSSAENATGLGAVWAISSAIGPPIGGAFTQSGNNLWRCE